MTKLALLASVAALVAAPAFATDSMKTTTSSSTTTTSSTPTAAELKDGTKIEITGDRVAVIGANGQKTPAPDAEHTLKDGTKVTTKGGVIVK